MQAYSLGVDIISGCWLIFVAIWVLAALSLLVGSIAAVFEETVA